MAKRGRRLKVNVAWQPEINFQWQPGPLLRFSLNKMVVFYLTSLSIILSLAANCLNFKTPEMVNLRAGSNDTQSGGRVYKVSKFVIYPKYNYNSSEYDVALLNLTTPFSCQAHSDNTSIQECSSWFISCYHWVSMSVPTFSHTLRKLDLSILDPLLCRNYYGKKFNLNTMLCTKNDKYKGVCAFSGFPLVVNSTLVGIYSMAYGCTVTPTIYTKLSAQPIRSWITSVTRI
ncbi:hypothetical protein V1477_014912 [Vespula maculifrons]|uniref:Peptidase S1 domain-containing protein n=1 Tax=Vespula maculifrons TaxID=7453 RepID=A0ABD2BIS4_VESMC